MKKNKILVLILFLCLSLFMVAGCNNNGNQEIKYEIDTSMIDEEIPISSFDLSLIRIKVIKPDGTENYVNVTDSMISLDDANKLKTVGTHTITIIYKLFTGTVNVKLVEDPEGECSYELDTSNLPDNLYVGVFKISDIKIKVTDSKGEVTYVNVNEGMLAKDDIVKLTQVGEHSLTITYKTLVRKLTIILKEKPKDVITYELDTSKLSSPLYTNTFILSDVRIKVTTNGNVSYVNVDSSMISSEDLEKLTKVGTHTIKVNYKDFSNTFTITLLAPTATDGKFNSTNSYYNAANGKSGMELKMALRTIISKQKHIETYGELRYDLQKTDEDPERKGYVKLIYSPQSAPAKWDPDVNWNREHVWPQSQGWFKTSNAGADLHHLRPETKSVNSSRGSKPFADTTSGGSFVPRDESKGDVARILFYLLTRYSESDSYSITKVATSFEMLVRWNKLDPVDDFERQRNDRSFEIQGNRNPYIDHPEAVDMIWGTTKMIMSEHEEYEVVVIEYLVDYKNKEYYI